MEKTKTKPCWAGVILYETEETVPKRLAPENQSILRDGLWMPDEPGRFYLTPGKVLRDKLLWYELDGRWLQAEWTGQMWEIPQTAAECLRNCQSSLCSAKAKVSFLEKGEKPGGQQERMVVFHYLRERKEKPYADQ